MPAGAPPGLLRRARRALAASVLAACAWSGALGAHPLAPALLQLQQGDDPSSWSVTWRTSVSRAGGAAVAPVLPPACAQSADAAPALVDEALVQRWQLNCPAGLAGQSVAVSGLAASGINVIVRIEPRHGAVVQALLDAGHGVFEVPAVPDRAGVAAGYFTLGIGHLLGGHDHLLFLLGLLLLVRQVRPLLYTVTGFTLGHSLTLAAATLGFLRVDARLAEFGIAASLLWLACLIARPDRAASARLRRPWLMAGVFGLLHGLGFAGALREVGLPAGDVLPALLAFNLGIEAAGVGVVLLAAPLLALARGRTVPGTPPAAALRLLPAYAIGILAAAWCFDRAASLLV